MATKSVVRSVRHKCYAQQCHFRKGRDIMEVVPDASEDITAAIFDGSIRDANIPKLYNGFQNTEEIGYRAHDVFDLEDYSHEFTRLQGEARKKAEDAL